MLTLHPCVCMRLERRYVRIRGVTKWRATASKHGRLRAAVKTWKLARKKAAEGGAQGVAQRPAEDGATTNDEEMRKYVPQERGAWTTTRQNDMANWEKLLSKEFCDTFNNKAHLAQIQFTPCLHTKAKTEATVVKMAAGLLQRVRAKRLPQPDRAAAEGVTKWRHKAKLPVVGVGAPSLDEKQATSQESEILAKPQGQAGPPSGKVPAPRAPVFADAFPCEAPPGAKGGPGLWLCAVIPATLEPGQYRLGVTFNGAPVTDVVGMKESTATVPFVVFKLPRVTAITPPCSPSRGGTQVVIKGTQLRPQGKFKCQVKLVLRQATCVMWCAGACVRGVSP